MRFEVIVPCYNKKPDIVSRCFDSIRQAYDSYEGDDLDLHIMVVDDCSTEYSEELKQATISAFDDSGAKWVYHRNGENLGCFLSRAIGTVASVISKGEEPGWLVHIDPDDTFLPCFFNVIIPFIKGNCNETTHCIPIEAEVYSVKGDYWDNDDVAYMKDFPSLRAVAEAGQIVWNSVCDKVWNAKWFLDNIAMHLDAYANFDKLKHVNYMEDFLYSMIYMQFDCNFKYLPTRIERAYMDEEGSSCNETELGDDAKDKLRACMKQIHEAVEFLIRIGVINLDTLTAVRYTHQMDRLINDYKLQ